MVKILEHKFHQYLKTILVTIFLIINLFSDQLHAQSVDSLKQGNQLHNVTKANPYNSSQTNWLKRNSFDIEAYNWNDLEINIELKDAFKKRTGSGIWAGLAFGSFYLGSEDQPISVGLLGFVGSQVLMSWAKSNSAKKSINRAEALRSKFMLNETTLKPIEKRASSKTVLTNALQKSDLKWLIRNGFESNDYHWDDEKISLYLNKSLNQNRTKKTTNIIGLTTMALGLFQHYASLLVQEEEKKRGYTSSGNNMLVVSGGFFMTSIILNGASLRNLSIAKRLKARNDF